ALGADDALRHRAGQPKWRADGQHAVADLHRVAVAKLQVGQRLFRLDADDGQVGLRIGLDVARQELAAVLERDLHLVGAVHDVEIRQGGARGGQDKARAEAEAGRLIGQIELLTLEVLEEAAELLGNALLDRSAAALGGRARLGGWLALALDAHHGWQDLLHDVAVRSQLPRNDGGLRRRLSLQERSQVKKEAAGQNAEQQKRAREQPSFHG